MKLEAERRDVKNEVHKNKPGPRRDSCSLNEDGPLCLKISSDETFNAEKHNKCELSWGLAAFSALEHANAGNRTGTD